MATVHAHLDEPSDQATATVREVAAEQGWALAEGESGPGRLVFRKGVGPTSWGSEVTVSLESLGPAETRLSFATAETFAITDWGRGRRQIGKLLEALGASKE